MNCELSPEQRREVAYHEAGHAVMLHSLGMPLEEVSILGDQKSLGRTGWGPWGVRLGDAALLVSRFYHVIVDLSGDIAQARFAGGKPFTIMPRRGQERLDELHKDRTHTHLLCLQIVSSFLLASQGGGAVSCGDSEEVRRTEEVLQWAAMALVEKHWPEIEAVANALLEREELNGSQVAFLCETEKVRCAEKQKGA